MHPTQGAECPGQLQRARRAACLSFGLPGVSWHKILPSLSYSAAKSKPKSSTSAYLRLVCSCWELISVRDFCGLEGGCLGLFCIVCVRQNSSTTAKEEAREGTSYPYSKEINSVIFHLEITNISKIWEDCIHADDICTVFCWVGNFRHCHQHASNFFQTLSLWGVLICMTFRDLKG